MADSARPFSSAPIPQGARVACCVEYNGKDFCGWQRQSQPHVRTVQSEVEQALANVANQPVRVHCAGRTDTGVHAHAQIIHFDAPVTRSEKAWTVGVNTTLPADVRVHWAREVPPDFHARFSAVARSYRYLILNAPVRSARLHGLVTWHRSPLDAVVMHEAAQSLLGERDFSAFRAASCQSDSPMRCMHLIRVERSGSLVLVDVQANAFLHHMVRNIVGTLLAVGDGRAAPGWVPELMATRDRTLAADTAPADGLYLKSVDYPDAYQLPEHHCIPEPGSMV